MIKMKNIGWIFFLLLMFSCKGQNKEKSDVLVEKSAISAVDIFNKQKHRFEIKGYKLYYNGTLLKLDTLVNTAKILGNPIYQEPHEFSYDNKPIRIKISANRETNKDGMYLFLYNGKVYPRLGKTDKETDKLSELWIKSGGGKNDLYLKDASGNYAGSVESYYIYLRPFEEGRKYPLDTNDNFHMAMKNTPVVDGYVMVDGVPIDKNTTITDMKNILEPVVGDKFGGIMGTPTIIYELSEKEMKEIKPNFGNDKAYNRIFIGFEMIKDPETGKTTGVKSIHYYCFM